MIISLHLLLPFPPATAPTCAEDRRLFCSFLLATVYYLERSDLTEHCVSPSPVANLTMQLAYRNKDKLSAGMIIGGWDAKEGAQVYGIPLGGSLTRTPFTAGEGGVLNQNHNQTMNLNRHH